MEWPPRMGAHCQADVLAISGRWNNHWSAFILILVLRCSAEPHPKYVAAGICLYFYLGMDY